MFRTSIFLRTRSYARPTRTTSRPTAILPALFLVLAANLVAMGQDPAASPSPDERFTVTASTEIGARLVDVNGSENKFRSDLNYRSGFRVFDSSISIDDNSTGYKVFDSATIIASGWGADPSGFLRFNMQRTGLYRLDTNVRRVSFINNLNNHALNQHNADTRRTFGDVDLTIFPERPDFRLRFGYSLNTVRGDGGYTTRAFGDEFPVTSFVSSKAHDFRAGADGKLLGFNLSLSYGYRNFDDHTRYESVGLNLGNNPTNNTRLLNFDRRYPVLGESHYGIFSLQRTFAERFDVSARVSHATTTTRFTLFELITGRDNSNNQIDLDRIEVEGDAKRPQTRGDLGLTFLATDKLRISNTSTFDTYNISGGNLFAEAVFSRTAAGVPRPTVFTNTLAHRITDYQRFINTFEVDYQFNERVGVNVGYRFTHREVALEKFDRNFASPNPETFAEEFDNSTNTLLAGMRIKPLKNWSIYWDLEHGKADNAFTRLGNSDITNFRVRSRTSFNKWALNLSAIIKNNENPSRNIEQPPRDFAADTRSRIFTGSLDWMPDERFNVSTGYTYHQLTAETNIIVPVSGQRREGLSQFFMRDHYAFVDVTARPIRRVTFFGSYRINTDRGQRDLISTAPENIITSYPMTFHTPEARLAIRLNRYLDWNLGYQYYNYNEDFPNAQNYNAHLPYMSLRIYFGRNAADR